MSSRLLFALVLSSLATTALADGPELQNVGVSVLDAITDLFRKYMNFMTGSFAPFVAVIGGTAAVAALATNAKEGLMASILKWVGVAVGILSVPSMVVTLQGFL